MIEVGGQATPLPSDQVATSATELLQQLAAAHYDRMVGFGEIGQSGRNQPVMSNRLASGSRIAGMAGSAVETASQVRRVAIKAVILLTQRRASWFGAAEHRPDYQIKDQFSPRHSHAINVKRINPTTVSRVKRVTGHCARANHRASPQGRPQLHNGSRANPTTTPRIK